MDSAEHLDLEAQPPARGSRPLRHLLLLLAGGLPAAASLLAFGGAWWWPLDLLSHFRFQYVVILLVAGALCLLARQRVWALLLAVVLGVNVYMVADLYRPIEPGRPLPWLAQWWPRQTERQTDEAAGPTLGLMSLRAPDRPQVRHAMFDLITTCDADVVVIFNMTEAMAHYVHYGSGPFRSRVVEPREDGFGLAVLVREDPADKEHGVSLISHELVDPLLDESAASLAISLILQQGDRELAVLIARLVPPTSEPAARVHQQQVQGIIRWVRQQQRPVVVVTDFSATPWSVRFRELIDQTGLVNSQKGFGLQSTWPSTGGPLGKLPIDHILHSPDFQTLKRTLGPSVGADRHTLALKLAWPHAPTSTIDSPVDPTPERPDDDDQP